MKKPFGPRRLVVATLAVVSLVAAILLARRPGHVPEREADPRPSAPVAAVEVLRSELQQLDGRYCRVNETNGFTGLMIERYTGGVLRSRSAVRDGLLDGVSEGWHTNGQRQVTEQFVAGVSHGLRCKWYPDGQKLSETMIVNGRLHGVHRRWHASGVLAEEVTMKAGQADGLARAFHPGGGLRSEVTLSNGVVLTQRFWREGEAPRLASAVP